MALTSFLRPIAQLGLAVALLACGSGSTTQQAKEAAQEPFPYELSEPTQTYQLPRELKEVSGLGWYRKNQLVMVNDEQGKVFVYDIARGQVVETLSFGLKGDYEGVEVVGDEIFVVESNGVITAFKAELPETRVLDPGLPSKTEIEGLGYDAKANRLLLAVKSASKKGKELHDKIVYTFDLKSKSVWQGLVIPEEVLQQAEKDFNLPKKEKLADCKLSGVAIHPQNRAIYLLASVGKKLLVVNRQGQISQVISLNEKLFPQPEGICFGPDGTLFIASESNDKKGGKLFQFDVLSSLPTTQP
ncbi:MAG: SdiA-regulated domain-containing protein [Spirosomataceae bacterium]